MTAQVLPLYPATGAARPLEGLYLGGCGCHGGPGITFVPGYNAAHAALSAS